MSYDQLVAALNPHHFIAGAAWCVVQKDYEGALRYLRSAAMFKKLIPHYATESDRPIVDAYLAQVSNRQAEAIRSILAGLIPEAYTAVVIMARGDSHG